MVEWHTLLDQLEIPDGAVAGLSASGQPVLRSKLLQLPAADRPLFFVGQPLEVLKTLRTLLPDAPSGQLTVSSRCHCCVACCSNFVHHEGKSGQHLSGSQQQETMWKKRTYNLYIVNPVLHGNGTLAVYGSELAVGLGLIV